MRVVPGAVLLEPPARELLEPTHASPRVGLLSGSVPPIAGGSPAAAVRGEGPAAAAPTQAPPMVPFDQASHRGMEPGPQWSVQPGSSQVTLGPVPLPAQGYLRRVLIEVVAAGGAGAATGAGDFPFNVLAKIRLQDTNGAPMTELSGYNLMLADTYGGYAGSPDPRVDPDYAATAANPVFTLSVPVEIGPNGLGALANMSASAAYRLTLVVDTTANIWTSAPATTIPTFTIRTWMDFWTLPAAADMLRRPQQQVPPFNGTAQYWTEQPNVSVASGNNNTRISRVGGLIRTLIFVARASGVRSDTPFPDPLTLNWDARDLRIASARMQRKIMREMVADLTARDTGVYAFTFSYGEGRFVGDIAINSWLPTVTATRLELDGSSGGAGTLDILVNDVSVAETSPAARAVETSASGYHPPVGPVVMGAQ
jgi:hypothetical protein